MRAPSERSSAYSEAQWEVIKAVVAELSVEADRVTWRYDEEGRRRDREWFVAAEAHGTGPRVL